MSNPMPLDPVPLRDISDAPSLRDRVSRGRQLRVMGITAAVLAIIVAGFAVYHQFDKAGTAAMMKYRPPPTPISVATAEVKPVAKFLSGVGTLQAVRQVTVAPEVGGMITQIMFTPGAVVNAGDPLV
jgi:multidrug efflux system membrane fusion protein